MPTIDDLLHAEYEVVKKIWAIHSRYIKKIPLTDADYKDMVNDGNELAKARKGESQRRLAHWIDAVEEEVEYLDLKWKEMHNDEK